MLSPLNQVPELVHHPEMVFAAAPFLPHWKVGIYQVSDGELEHVELILAGAGVVQRLPLNLRQGG